MKITESKDVKRRQDISQLLNSLGLIGEAVEVGTHVGWFAAAFLRGWKGRMLHCIDPWITNMPDYADMVNDRPDREADMRAAIKTLSRFPGRTNIIRATSEDASKQFDDKSLDCVYIDGNHGRKYVEQDIDLWLPKLHAGGVLSGHDFSGVWESEIKPVVVRAAIHLDADLFVIPAFDSSWYLFKP
jgi:predicted O-methyltransferase YrrM